MLRPTRKPIAFMLAATALATSIASAQPEGARPNPTIRPRVTVAGLGEVRVVPDMAVVTVESNVTRNTPREAAQDARKGIDAALAAARKVVRDTADLRTARVSLAPEYDWKDGKRVFRGYAAGQTLEIIVRDLGKLEGLLDELYKSPVTGLQGPEFRHSKADSLRRVASARAVRDARENVRVLCEAAGKSCEELAALRMGGAGFGHPPVAKFEAVRMAADAGASMPVQPGMLTFTATVEAEYRMR